MIARIVHAGRASVLFLAALMIVAQGTASAGEKCFLDFRLTDWKVAKFDDAKIADAFYAEVAKLGCQVKNGPHNGHIEVSYICPEWRRVESQNHKDVDEWEEWLKGLGFETKHSH